MRNVHKAITYLYWLTRKSGKKILTIQTRNVQRTMSFLNWMTRKLGMKMSKMTVLNWKRGKHNKTKMMRLLKDIEGNDDDRVIF
jgi:hypothetical protein